MLQHRVDAPLGSGALEAVEELGGNCREPRSDIEAGEEIPQLQLVVQEIEVKRLAPAVSKAAIALDERCERLLAAPFGEIVRLRQIEEGIAGECVFEVEQSGQRPAARRVHDEDVCVMTVVVAERGPVTSVEKVSVSTNV
jgi:hypothetical protein